MAALPPRSVLRVAATSGATASPVDSSTFSAAVSVNVVCVSQRKSDLGPAAVVAVRAARCIVPSQASRRAGTRACRCRRRGGMASKCWPCCRHRTALLHNQRMYAAHDFASVYMPADACMHACMHTQYLDAAVASTSPVVTDSTPRFTVVRLWHAVTANCVRVRTYSLISVGSPARRMALHEA